MYGKLNESRSYYLFLDRDAYLREVRLECYSQIKSRDLAEIEKSESGASISHAE